MTTYLITVNTSDCKACVAGLTNRQTVYCVLPILFQSPLP